MIGKKSTYVNLMWATLILGFSLMACQNVRRAEEQDKIEQEQKVEDTIIVSDTIQDCDSIYFVEDTVN